MSNSQEIQVITVDETDLTCLYHRYPGQLEAQPVFVEVDLENRTISIDWDGEIGNAIPVPVFHGRTLRFRGLPWAAHVANALLQELAPLAAQLASEATIDWDGSNRVGALSEAGERLQEEIEGVISSYQDEQQVVEMDAHDCFCEDSDYYINEIKELGWDEFEVQMNEAAEVSTFFDGDLVVVAGLEIWLEDLWVSWRDAVDPEGQEA